MLDRSVRNDALVKLRERILAFAALRIGKEAAEDLAQETLMVIEQRYADVSEPAELVALAFQIMRFKVVAWRRRLVRRGENTALPAEEAGLVDPLPSPEVAAARSELKQHLLEALSHMGERCRTLFRLKLAGRSFEEIRQAMGAAAINTVYTWDLRCRQELRTRLEAQK